MIGARVEYHGLVGDGTEVLNPITRHLSDYDSDDQEEYLQDLEENEDDVRAKFVNLVQTTFDSLEKNDIAISKLKIFFVEFFKTVDGHNVGEIITEFKKANTLCDIHAVVTKYYTFYNIDLIEKLIENFGKDDDRDHLINYNQCFEKFCITGGVVCGPYVHGKSKLSFKLNYDDSHEVSGRIMSRVKRKICKILKIRKATLYLRRIRKGCIEFDFLVSDSVCERVCQLTTEKQQELFKENITYVEVYNPSSKVTCSITSYLAKMKVVQYETFRA